MGIVTLSEMAFARGLARNDIVERARLRHSEVEAADGNCFGVQIATNTVDEGVRAARLAADAGARFVDLNCGCPIHEATRRGLGSALLRSPRKLARLVAGIAEGSALPLTVKIRLGVTDSTANVERVVPALVEAGAAAVTIHGRSGEGRYKKAADWGAIERAAAAAATAPGASSLSPAGSCVPIVGNGDILTFWEAQRRLSETRGVSAVMIGRGALIRPWIFAEVRSGAEWLPGAEERAVRIYRRLVLFYREYLGDDAKGEHKSRWFLPSSVDFLNRYRPLPQSVYGGDGGGGASGDPPLMSRRDDLFDPRLGETLALLSPLERLLRCPDPESHAAIAAALWRSESDGDAVRRLENVARDSLEAWEERVREGGLFRSSSSSRDGDDEEGLGGEEGDERSRGRGRGSPGRGTRSRKLAKMKKEAEEGVATA